MVLLNLTCTVKDSCEPKCPFLSLKVHRVSFSDNFVQNYRKIQLIQSIFEKFMQPNDRFCCLCAWFQPNWNIMNRVKFGELVVVIVLGQLLAPPPLPPVIRFGSKKSFFLYFFGNNRSVLLNIQTLK